MNREELERFVREEYASSEDTDTAKALREEQTRQDEADAVLRAARERRGW